MARVLVTGAHGQLGRCLKDASSSYSTLDFDFVTKADLDITDRAAITDYFKNNNIDFCINTAAYTNVEKAESEEDQAFKINAEAVKNLAKDCAKNNVVLLHVSTDYVFDGTKGEPYLESDTTNPINVYGASKLQGETHIREACKNHYIVRTSWLYSQYGHNFLKTILKYAKQEKPLTITTEQTGTPTNANDLATVLLDLIVSEKANYGTYHFSNKGEGTWYDFAKEIIESSNLTEKTKLAQTDYYRTFAKRPVYSVLNISKLERAIPIQVLDWKESLKTVLLKRSISY